MPSRQRKSTAPPPPAVDAASRPERWALSAGDAPTASLTIPADARRERRFEIACAMTVQGLAEAAGAWHEMTVWADGQQQWTRRVPTHNPGAWDGLDFRFRRSVAVGRSCRIVVTVACQGGRRRSLEIEADEV